MPISLNTLLASKTSATLADNVITSAKIAPNAIISADIADGNVTTSKIADSAITLAKIAEPGPKISSVTYPGDDLAVSNVGGQTVIITGTGFRNGATVYIGSTVATSVTFTSETSLSITTPALTAGDYLLYVINPDGSTGIGVPGLSVSGVPAWVTASGALANTTESAYSTTINATSDSNVSYTILSGALPEGFSLNANTGTISGTLASNVANLSSNTTYNITVDAKDVQNQNTSRAFSITYIPTFPTWNSPNAGALTSGIEGTSYTANLNATSNSGITYSIPSGNLVANIAISGSTLTGTPPEANTYYFTIRATDAEGHSTDRNFNVNFSVNQYQISRSLRFNSADSAYLSRTPSSAGNRKTWTYSAWFKRTVSGNSMRLLSTGTDDNNTTEIYFLSGNNLDVLNYVGNAVSARLTTNQVFRDFSAWQHIVVAFDTTQATSSNRVKLYINGSEVTSLSTATYPTQNADTFVNATNLHTIGQYFNGGSYYASMYLADINFVDGQALTPSSFGQINSTTGVWEPKGYSSSYGTNGFYLNFSDNSGTTSTTLGKDTSGNNNNWTPSGFSVTAGVGNDSLVDSPTSYGTYTGAGGEVRGNFCTLNPLSTSPQASGTLSNGNLQLNGDGSGVAYSGTVSNFGFSSGKWYAEFTVTTVGSIVSIGILNQENISSVDGSNYGFATPIDSIVYANIGYIQGNSSTIDSGLASYTNGDIVNIAVDYDAGKIWFGKNGTWYNSGNPGAGTNPSTTFTPSSKRYLFCVNGYGTTPYVVHCNFGQRAFAYTAPSGFKSACVENFSTPAVVQGDDYFNTVLYTGNGSTQSITGVGFQPDFVWTKARSAAYSHLNYDAVRGVTKYLSTNGTGAEGTAANSLTAFNSDGFTLGSDENSNTNGVTSVAWNWKANGAGSSNTAGTISSTVSASTTSGFSIVTYTGTGSSATVGHGLGAAPSMIIVKGRTNTVAWAVYHSGLTAGNEIYLNLTNAQASSANFGSAPTSTVFNLGTDTNANGNGVTYVAYCFAPIAGFSAFGKYTGNGSSNGIFLYLGFRPAFVILKRINTTEDWVVVDSKRNPFNVTNLYLLPSSSGAEGSTTLYDFVSNGIKFRGNSQNENGSTYIYAAFAEHPFKYALAR